MTYCVHLLHMLLAHDTTFPGCINSREVKRLMAAPCVEVAMHGASSKWLRRVVTIYQVLVNSSRRWHRSLFIFRMFSSGSVFIPCELLLTNILKSSL